MHDQVQRVARGAGFVEQSGDDLLRAVATGDDRALAVLRERHTPGLRRFLVSQLNDHALADEALADTWVEVWRSAHGFQGASSVRTWIFGIARHCKGRTLRWHRRLDADRAGRPRLVALDEARHEALFGAVPDPADIIAARPFASGHGAAVSRLPVDLRTVLQLQFDQRFTYAEIATILEIPETTVRMRLHRARTRVRSGLNAP